MMRCCDVHGRRRGTSKACCHNPKAHRRIVATVRYGGPELDQAPAAPVAWANTRNVPAGRPVGRRPSARRAAGRARHDARNAAPPSVVVGQGRTATTERLRSCTGYHGARRDDALIGVFASELGENVDEELRCYAARYPDLLAGFCGGDLDACEWGRLDDHWRLNGHPEGRVYGCDDAPPSPPLPADAQPAERFETAPCGWTAGLENLRARSTPVWCSEHNGDRIYCRQSFVRRRVTRRAILALRDNSATKACYKSADSEDCPPPGAGLAAAAAAAAVDVAAAAAAVAAAEGDGGVVARGGRFRPPPPSHARLPPPPPRAARSAGTSGRQACRRRRRQPGLPALSLEFATAAERPAAVRRRCLRFELSRREARSSYCDHRCRRRRNLLCVRRRLLPVEALRPPWRGRRAADGAHSALGRSSVRRRSRRGYSAAPATRRRVRLAWRAANQERQGPHQGEPAGRLRAPVQF